LSGWRDKVWCNWLFVEERESAHGILVGKHLESGNFKEVKEEGTITLTRISEENKLL
jgi:hypothetical protein